LTTFSTGKRPTNELRELSGRLLRIQDAEHPRIARELHDSIAQELAAVSMNLDELQKRIEGRDRAGDNLLSDSMGTGACRRRGAEGSESLEFGGALLATPRSCKQLPSRRNRLRMFPVGATLLPYLRLYTAVCAGDGFPAEEQVASIRVFPSFT
jgi:hypothetical protein